MQLGYIHYGEGGNYVSLGCALTSLISLGAIKEEPKGILSLGDSEGAALRHVMLRVGECCGRSAENGDKVSAEVARYPLIPSRI